MKNISLITLSLITITTAGTLLGGSGDSRVITLQTPRSSSSSSSSSSKNQTLQELRVNTPHRRAQSSLPNIRTLSDLSSPSNFAPTFPPSVATSSTVSERSSSTTVSVSSTLPVPAPSAVSSSSSSSTTPAPSTPTLSSTPTQLLAPSFPTSGTLATRPSSQLSAPTRIAIGHALEQLTSQATGTAAAASSFSLSPLNLVRYFLEKNETLNKYGQTIKVAAPLLLSWMLYPPARRYHSNPYLLQARSALPNPLRVLRTASSGACFLYGVWNLVNQHDDVRAENRRQHATTQSQIAAVSRKMDTVKTEVTEQGLKNREELLALHQATSSRLSTLTASVHQGFEDQERIVKERLAAIEQQVIDEAQKGRAHTEDALDATKKDVQQTIGRSIKHTTTQIALLGQRIQESDIQRSKESKEMAADLTGKIEAAQAATATKLTSLEEGQTATRTELGQLATTANQTHDLVRQLASSSSSSSSSSSQQSALMAEMADLRNALTELQKQKELFKQLTTLLRVQQLASRMRTTPDTDH